MLICALQNGTVTVRNVFGGAELLETVASFGTRTSSAFQVKERGKRK